MKTYLEHIDGITTDYQIATIEADYELQKTTAKLLGITLDEYLDFIADMEVNTIEYTLEEIEGMYAEYCQEYDIPCEQLKDYPCFDRMGW